MKNFFTVVLFAILLFAFSTVFGQWSKYTIDSYLYSATIVDVADINCDGNLDVAVTGWRGDRVVWYENGGGTPINWIKHIIDTNLDGAAFLHVAYINNGTYPDAVVTGQNANNVVWYKNPGYTRIE